jgi:hypothetical protein
LIARCAIFDLLPLPIHFGGMELTPFMLLISYICRRSSHRWACRAKGMVIGNRCVNIRAPDAVKAPILNRAEVGLKLTGTVQRRAMLLSVSSLRP